MDSLFGFGPSHSEREVTASYEPEGEEQPEIEPIQPTGSMENEQQDEPASPINNNKKKKRKHQDISANAEPSNTGTHIKQSTPESKKKKKQKKSKKGSKKSSSKKSKHTSSSSSSTEDTVSNKKKPKATGPKRHRKREILYDQERKISKGAIRRLARRAGIKRIGGYIYDLTRDNIKEYTEKLVNKALLCTDSCNRSTLSQGDVLYGLDTTRRVTRYYSQI